MKILYPLPLDYAAVEFTGEEWSEFKRPAREKFPKYPCVKVLHVDDLPQQVIDDYNNSHYN